MSTFSTFTVQIDCSADRMRIINDLASDLIASFTIQFTEVRRACASAYIDQFISEIKKFSDSHVSVPVQSQVKSPAPTIYTYTI